MNKEIAQKLLHELLECRKAIDSAEIVSREIDDENLRQEFRKILGRASLDLYSEAMGKIILRYPELDPYSKKT
jgi:NTP pyrophosphatase (non-canonical NTP hydrolase)